MLMSLREAYNKFSESHASTNIGLSKFCELRPKDVKLFDHIPHHVCIIPKGKGMVMVSDTSDSKEYTIVPLRKPDSTDSEEEAVTPLDKSQEPLDWSEETFIESEEHTITTVDLCVWQWVVVNYDGEDFPGEITCCDGNDQFEVSEMHKSGNHWKWPKTIDKILYARDDIVRTINPPRAAGHRGQFLLHQL